MGGLNFTLDINNIPFYLFLVIYCLSFYFRLSESITSKKIQLTYTMWNWVLWIKVVVFNKLKDPFLYFYYNWYILCKFHHFILCWLNVWVYVYIHDLFPLLFFDSSSDILENSGFLVFRLKFKCHLFRKYWSNLAVTLYAMTLKLLLFLKFLHIMANTKLSYWFISLIVYWVFLSTRTLAPS